jgi:hypothetical protein
MDVALSEEYNIGVKRRLPMNSLLAEAFEQANRLPDVEQSALAKWLLDELQSEKKWSEAFTESEDVLERLADEALDAKRHGKTTPLTLDRL